MSLNLLANAKSKFKSFLKLCRIPLKDETKFLVAQRGVSRKVDEEEQLHCSIISTNNKFPKLEKHLKYPIPQVKDYHYPSSICNGLLLLSLPGSYDYYKREMTKPPGVALWNPTTGEYKILPLPLSNIDPSPWCRTMFGGYFGFGFDSASEDYKVIRLFNQSDDRTAAVLAEVYSLRSNSWKQVSVVHPLCFPHGSGVYGVHVNGTYYWLNLSDPGFIVSFDFATEKFASSLIPTPPSNNLIREDAYEYYYANLKLVEYCGLLGAVVMWNEGNGKISCCLEIWVWDGSWSLESTLTVPSYVGLQSLVGTDEELIFLDSFGKTRFFDCETSKLKKIHSLPTSEEAHIFPLVESYVPL